ncbi:MAG: hypothetical protein GX154_08525 [Clostridiales bacterium]|nr:hypothetical protein [Clostridiales bacterium]
MSQIIVESKINEHKCFYCKESFNYQVDIKTGRQSYGLFQVTSVNAPIANYAFIDNGAIEVDAVCPHCANNNRFTIKT